MAYQKQIFTDNETVLTAAHLEHMERGIADTYTEIPKLVRWEDLQNKPLPEPETEDILPEQSVTLAYVSSFEVYGSFLPTELESLTAGRTYITVIDGVAYKNTAVLSSLSGEPVVFIGNDGWTATGVWSGDCPFLAAILPPAFTGMSANALCFAANVSQETASVIRIYECPDEGKVLAVSGGGYVLAEHAGADALPGVTTADDGKILQVVEGVWASVSVADSAVAAYVDDYINTALGGDY